MNPHQPTITSTPGRSSLPCTGSGFGPLILAASLSMAVGVPGLVQAATTPLDGFPASEFPLTDTARHAVDFDEILSGGPPRDGIPAIDTPQFESADAAGSWLEDSEPVIAFEHQGIARAYPLQILMFHEIVNDTVAGLPVAVTFCPLCNASIVFEREVDGTQLDFGTTGRLRRSDLVMYDRQSESWWQQFSGRGLIGQYTDVELVQRASQIVSMATFKDSYPDGNVLSRPTDTNRPYGQNPYTGYDDIDSNPFLYHGDIDPRLPPMERVLALAPAEQRYLVALGALSDNPVLNLTLDEIPVVVLAAGSARSALDQSSIAGSRLIPAAAAFDARREGQTLTFKLNGDGIPVDDQTGSQWNAFGHAIAGELKGTGLQQLDHGVHFAFAWLAFDPDAQVVNGLQ